MVVVLQGKGRPGFHRLALFLLLPLFFTGCASRQARIIETTAYCGCGQCCSWERGSRYFFYLDFWNKYVSKGPSRGRVYTGLTASGTDPGEPAPGLFSYDSFQHPWLIPVRAVFPWLWLPQDGTIAADTNYYPFGTRMHVPGYGWGMVLDRGAAIKGPDRIDLFFASHKDALAWGRRKLTVEIEPR